MNLHTLLDSVTAFTGAIAAGKHKFFSDSIDSPTFTDYFHRLDISVPEIGGEGKYEIDVESPLMGLDPAYWVYQWKGWDTPTILFHHGNNEDPFDMGRFTKQSFKMIFEPNRDTTDANIIALRAPYHGGSLKEYTSKIKDMAHFVALLATSVMTVESLVQQLKEHSSSEVLVSGISLGGWVTNLHRSHFNTADGYAPLLAGAALAEVFLTSKYTRLTGKLALTHPEQVRAVLNFEQQFAANETRNVFPLLGKYDQFIQYQRQRGCYQGLVEPRVLEKGHVTSLLDASTLYTHIIEALNKCEGELNERKDSVE